MRKAAGSFIDLVELNDKAGAYLAKRIGVEAAAISCGAASGMQLSAAACLTGPRSCPRIHIARDGRLEKRIHHQSGGSPHLHPSGDRGVRREIGPGRYGNRGGGRGYPLSDQQQDRRHRPFSGKTVDGTVDRSRGRGRT